MKHLPTNQIVACCKIKSGQQKILKAKRPWYPIFMGLLLFFLTIGAESQLTAQTANALSFQDSYVIIENPLSVALSNQTAVTIEAWVKPTLHTFMGTVFCTRVGHTNKLQLYLDNAGRVIYLIGSNGNRFMAQTTATLSLNTWYHVAAVFDGTQAITTNRLKIYINGVLQTVTNPETQYSTTTGTYNVQSRIGDEVSPNFPAPIRGVLDEVRIWTEARSAAEVDANRNISLTGSEANLVAYYEFNQGIAGGNNTAITTLIDKTGIHNGTLSGFALTGTASNFVASPFGSPPPAISSFSPTTATAGQTVTITGTNLSETTAVSFGGTAAASFINVNSTTVTAVVASGASGNVSLSNVTGTAISSGFTYVSVPGAPTAASAQAGYKQATVSFNEPAYEGTSEITAYTVTSSPGGITATGTSSPITITGLTNETAYTFTVAATNAVGTGAASIPSNSVTPSTFIFGNALNFSSSFVTVDNQLSHSLSNQSAITIETWVKFDAFTRLATIFSQRQHHASKIQFGLDDLANNDRLFFQIGSNGNLSSAFTESTINLDTWYHVAAVFDGTQAIPADRLKIYINGELQIVTNWDSNFSTTTGDLDVVTYIGSENFNPSVPLYGSMDETRIWTTARTPAEINSNMSTILSGTESGLAAYYRYDQGIAAGNNTSLPLELIDYSGNCNHGTMNSFAMNGSVSNWIASEKSSVPIPTTLTPTALTSYTATLNGRIFSVGAENVTTRGFLYSTSDCPTLANTVVSETGSYTAETFNLPISGLTPGIIYYVRAYAINAFGTSYGELQSFTTPLLSQTITFDALTSRTYGDAPFTISATGGESVNPVVFTSSDPTIATCSGTNGSTITIVEAGNCIIYANQAGSATYAPATQVGQALTINPKNLTISDVSANNKVYDGTTTAILTEGTLNGVETGDAVSFTAGTGTFTSANVGTAIVVTATGFALTGADAGNYSVSQPAGLSADITAKPITIAGVTANNKVYDGTTTAILTGGSLIGVETGDAVSFTAGTGTFATANAGTAIEVTATGYALTGADAGNYSVSQPAGLSADITAKPITIAGVTANSKVYDGTTTAILTGGSLIGVETGDAVSFTAGTGTFATANAGTAIVVTAAGYALTGADAPNYSVSQPAGLSADITAKELTINNTIVETTKEYDGNTTAAVISNGTISGVAAIDETSLGFTVEANYTDALPGVDKIITVVYTLTGPPASNYVVFGYQITNGVIEGTITPRASYSAIPGCAGNETILNYTIIEGEPIEYRIVFSAVAKTQGFTDIEYSELPSLASSGIITYPIPENAKYGNYEAQIQLRDEVGNENAMETFSFTINLSSDYIVAKFDDVVLCDNSSGEFVSYQWYKDGVIIDGATNQFYNDVNGLSGAYSVSVVTTDGQTFHSCDKYLKTSGANAAALKVYPNPVSISEFFIVQIDNLEYHELQGAVMRIYNNSGIMVFATEQVELQNSISLPLNGVYHGILITRDGIKLTYKVIVGK